MFNCIKIDPIARTITPWVWNGELETLYREIGQGCDCVDMPRINAAGDCLAVHDRGQIDGQRRGVFLLDGYHFPLAGNGIVFGVNHRTGDTRDAQESIEQLAARVRWMGEHTMGTGTNTFDLPPAGGFDAVIAVRPKMPESLRDRITEESRSDADPGL